MCAPDMDDGSAPLPVVGDKSLVLQRSRCNPSFGGHFTRAINARTSWRHGGRESCKARGAHAGYSRSKQWRHTSIAGTLEYECTSIVSIGGHLSSTSTSTSRRWHTACACVGYRKVTGFLFTHLQCYLLLQRHTCIPKQIAEALHKQYVYCCTCMVHLSLAGRRSLHQPICGPPEVCMSRKLVTSS